MAFPLSETGFDMTRTKRLMQWSSEPMRSKKTPAAILLIVMIFATGCAAAPPITVLSKDCVWAQPFNWTTKEADQIVDCCPELARRLLTHNAMHQEFCR